MLGAPHPEIKMVSSISMTHTYIEPNKYEGRNTWLLRYTISLFKLDPRNRMTNIYK